MESGHNEYMLGSPTRREDVGERAGSAKRPTRISTVSRRNTLSVTTVWESFISSLRDVRYAGDSLPTQDVYPSHAESDRITLVTSRNGRARLTERRSARGKRRPVGLVSR